MTSRSPFYSQGEGGWQWNSPPLRGWVAVELTATSCGVSVALVLGQGGVPVLGRGWAMASGS
eukprot:1536218-Amphidinium_carterae.1